MSTPLFGTPIGLARTWLLAPAADPEAIVAAHLCGADVLVLDLEDSVTECDKPLARDVASRWLGVGHPSWVRINDTTTDHWADDLQMLSDTRNIPGVVLTKTEDAYQVTATAARLPTGTPIVAVIGSALGLEEARFIARAEPTVRLAFDSNDFRHDTGSADDPMALSYARSRLVVASRAEHLAPPIEGLITIAADSDLQAGIDTGARAGMTGQLCLDPDHIPTINAALAPSAQDIAWAEDVITRLGPDGAHITTDSDRTTLTQALRVRRTAHAFSIVAT